MSGETAVFHNLRERLFARRRPSGYIPRSWRRATRTFARVLRGRRGRGESGARRHRRGGALCGGVSRHAHAAGSRRGVGRRPHPRARSRHRDRAVHRVFGRRSRAYVGTRWCRRRRSSPTCRSRSIPHEIRQMTISLASKWRAEHRIVKLAYFDAAHGPAEPRAIAQSSRERIQDESHLLIDHVLQPEILIEK